MGMSLAGIMHIGVSAAQAQQSAMAVTSHNIANSATPGYTRQRAELSTLPVLDTVNAQFGTGVIAATVTRMNSTFVDTGLRSEAGMQARYDTASTGLQELDSVLSSSGGAPIGLALTKFFNAAQSLTTNPESLAARQSLIDSGTQLAGQFNNATRQLNQLHSGWDQTVTQNASDINTALTQVADLNQQIATSQNGSGPANDLLDQRDMLVQQLGTFMDLNVTNGTNGMIDISVNGEALVTGVTANAVQAAATGAPPQMEIQSAAGVSLTTANGSLRGVSDLYAEQANVQTQLDTIASSVISEINAIHSAPGAAFDLNGNQGVAFFTGTDASTIAVNAVVSSDPSKVAAALTAAPGDSGAATAFVQLQDKKVLPGGAAVSTLSDSITNLASSVGSQSQTASDLKGVHDKALAAWQQRQQAVGGVSTDEELSSMMTMQHAYQAAARVISAVDDMMNTIINKTGAGT